MNLYESNVKNQLIETSRCLNESRMSIISNKSTSLAQIVDSIKEIYDDLDSIDLSFLDKYKP
jgi:hypothetical protein